MVLRVARGVLLTVARRGTRSGGLYTQGVTSERRAVYLIQKMECDCALERVPLLVPADTVPVR